MELPIPDFWVTMECRHYTTQLSQIKYRYKIDALTKSFCPGLITGSFWRCNGTTQLKQYGLGISPEESKCSPQGDYWKAWNIMRTFTASISECSQMVPQHSPDYGLPIYLGINLSSKFLFQCTARKLASLATIVMVIWNMYFIHYYRKLVCKRLS